MSKLYYCQPGERTTPAAAGNRKEKGNLIQWRERVREGERERERQGRKREREREGGGGT